MSEGNSIISVIVKRDNDHVMSFSEQYNSIVQYFGTDDFASYAAGADVNSELLRKISEGLTNYLRNSTDEALSWATNAHAVCTNAKVGRVENSQDNKAVFYVEIQSNKADGDE